MNTFETQKDNENINEERLKLQMELEKAYERIEILQKALDRALQTPQAQLTRKQTLVIRTNFSFVRIRNDEEYTLTYTAYDADMFGHPLENISENTEIYEFGDITIETNTRRYTFTKVLEPYRWVSAMIDYISKHNSNQEIFIDMNCLLREFNGDYAEFFCPSMKIEMV